MAGEQSENTDLTLDRPATRRVTKRAFLLPAVLYLLLFSIFPLMWSLGISFTDYQRGGGAAPQ